jgi:hypothetical protein
VEDTLENMVTSPHALAGMMKAVMKKNTIFRQQARVLKALANETDRNAQSLSIFFGKWIGRPTTNK